MQLTMTTTLAYIFCRFNLKRVLTETREKVSINIHNFFNPNYAWRIMLTLTIHYIFDFECDTINCLALWRKSNIL